MNRLTHNKYELSIFQKKEIPIKELKEFNYNLLTGIKSDKTLSDYFMYLMDFLRNIYEIGDHTPDNTEVLKMLYNVTKEDISNYIMLLKNERELKHSSINKIISALKHFFKEIETRDDSFINPIKNIKFFKKEPLDPEKILRLTKDDIRKMIDSIEIRNEKDLRKVKSKAIEVGVPYQTLINMIIHQYAENKIKLSVWGRSPCEMEPLFCFKVWKKYWRTSPVSNARG